MNDSFNRLFDSRPTGGWQNHDSNAVARQVLLILEILIGRYQNLESLLLGSAQQIAVLLRAPSFLKDSEDRVMREVSAQRNRRALIKENPHGSQRASGWRLRWACSSTASTCPRVTPGNQARNSSMRAPLSRFSNRAVTGTRVPRNTQAPLTLPVARSTTEQDDQSNMVKRLP